MEETSVLSSRRVVLRSLVYVFFLGLAIHFILPQLTSMRAAVDTLSDLQGYWLLAAVGAQILSYIASGGLIRACVQLSGEKITLGRGILVELAANTVGTLGGGFIGTAMTSYRWVRNRGVSQKAAAVSGWLPPIINNFVLVFLSNWGLLILLVRNQMSHIMLFLVILLEVMVAAALFATAWGLRHQAQVRTFAERAHGVWTRLWRKPLETEAVHSTMDDLFSSISLLLGGNWREPLLWSALNVGFDCATLVFLFHAVRRPALAGLLVAGYALPQLLGKVLMLPGGVGAVEASMIGLYATLGISRAKGVLVVLSYRALSFWIPTLAGLVIVPYLERKRPD